MGAEGPLAHEAGMPPAGLLVVYNFDRFLAKICNVAILLSINALFILPHSLALVISDLNFNMSTSPMTREWWCELRKACFESDDESSSEEGIDDTADNQV